MSDVKPTKQRKPRKSSCTICRRPKLRGNGIETTLGWFCYGCVRWVHQVSYQTRALRDNPTAADEQAEIS